MAAVLPTLPGAVRPSSDPRSSTPVLRIGDTGPEVARLGALLIDKGFLAPGTVVTSFDTDLLAAVHAFKEKVGYHHTNPPVDAQTWWLLQPITDSRGLPELHFGSHHPAVARLQMELHIEVDGVFGTATEAALEKFQRQPERHLNPDTIVGPKTWDALLGLVPPATAAQPGADRLDSKASAPQSPVRRVTTPVPMAPEHSPSATAPRAANAKPKLPVQPRPMDRTLGDVTYRFPDTDHKAPARISTPPQWLVPMIAEKAALWNLPPELVMSVLCQETDFNPLVPVEGGTCVTQMTGAAAKALEAWAKDATSPLTAAQRDLLGDAVAKLNLQRKAVSAQRRELKVPSHGRPEMETVEARLDLPFTLSKSTKVNGKTVSEPVEMTLRQLCDQNLDLGCAFLALLAHRYTRTSKDGSTLTNVATMIERYHGQLDEERNRLYRREVVRRYARYVDLDA